MESALVARELARHYSDCEAGDSVDAALRCLARACWMRAAETADPYVDETAAHEIIQRALAASEWPFLEARKVFEAGRFVMDGAAKDPLGQRLHRTYWLMACRLWETSVVDLPRRCAADCARPGQCESENDSTRSACAQSFVYPYLREEVGEPFDGEPAKLFLVPKWGATAKAIVDGLKGLHETGELNHRPEVDAVRKVLKRESAAPSGKRSDARARRS